MKPASLVLAGLLLILCLVWLAFSFFGDHGLDVRTLPVAAVAIGLCVWNPPSKS